jgi:2-methylaconitate cis-trans-isomerase PrpF
LPAEIESRADILATLEEIRARISERVGMCADWREAYQRYRTNPKIAFVSAPAAFRTLQGQQVSADSSDLMARVMAMGRMHKAFALTAAIPTAAASKIPGSVVHALCRHSSSTVRIGHPSGIMQIGIATSGEKENLHLQEVVVGRTARKLMDGHVFLPEA